MLSVRVYACECRGMCRADDELARRFCRDVHDTRTISLQTRRGLEHSCVPFNMATRYTHPACLNSHILVVGNVVCAAQPRKDVVYGMNLV